MNKMKILFQRKLVIEEALLMKTCDEVIINVQSPARLNQTTIIRDTNINDDSCNKDKMASINIVGSSTSVEHGPIEVNIYETTFLLQGLLVGGERDSKNISMVSEMIGCLDYDGGGSTLNILWKDWKKKNLTFYLIFILDLILIIYLFLYS